MKHIYWKDEFPKVNKKAGIPGSWFAKEDYLFYFSRPKANITVKLNQQTRSVRVMHENSDTWKEIIDHIEWK